MAARLNMQANYSTDWNAKQYYSDEGEEEKDEEFKAASNSLPDHLKEAYSKTPAQYFLQKYDNPYEPPSSDQQPYWFLHKVNY